MLWNPEEAELSWKVLTMGGGYFLSLSLLPAWRQPGSSHILYLLQSPSVATPSYPATDPTISPDNASHRPLTPHRFCYGDFRDWVEWALETRPSLSQHSKAISLPALQIPKAEL